MQSVSLVADLLVPSTLHSSLQVWATTVEVKVEQGNKVKDTPLDKFKLEREARVSTKLKRFSLVIVVAVVVYIVKSINGRQQQQSSIR